MNIEQKAAKSALTQDELKKIITGKRLNADTVAAMHDKALHSDRSYYDVSYIEDPAEREQAIDHARGDNAAIYMAAKEAYDKQMALAKEKKKTE